MHSSQAARQTIGQTFADLRARGQIGLVPFLAAGFPDLDTTIACLAALEVAGASVVELGFPFSDPIADGPVIQEAFTEALKKKIRVPEIFAAVRSVRAKVSIPLVAMLSYSIVFRYGVERFAAEAKAAGFDGLITPDLPPPEAERVSVAVQRAGLDTILLISPTTTPQRRKEITRLSSGFVYYLSVSGITGERDRLPPDLAPNLSQIKAITDRPVCVGFGIHQPHQVAQLAGVADGAIVGTAYVRRMQQHVGEGPQRLAEVVGDYTRQLLGQVR
jgi:tryptophan synthase alpha chain